VAKFKKKTVLNIQKMKKKKKKKRGEQNETSIASPCDVQL
jgi:hypothetical protein